LGKRLKEREDMGAGRPLTIKQEKFAQEYLVDCNATQAAIRAGYSEDTAEQQGCRLLRNVKVLACIEERQKELTAKTELTQEWVLNNLKEVIAKCMQAVEVEKWDYEDKCMVGIGEYVFDSKGANRALELIGKHLGMFKDSLNINANLSVQIVDDIND
jgi:phage terminase small subunit